MEAKRQHHNVWPKMALLCAALIWGSSFFVLKDTLKILDIAFVLAVRFTLSALILSAVFFRRWKHATKRMAAAGAGIGICLFAAYYTQTVGLAYTTPGKNAFLTAVYCIIVPFLAWAMRQGKPTKLHIAAAVIVLIGIALISFSDGDLSLSIGDLLTLISGFFYALQMVLIARYAADEDPVLLAIIQFCAAAVCAWIVSFASGDAMTFGGINVILTMVYLTVFCTAVCFVFQFVGLKYVNPSVAAILMSLESVFGLIFSMIFYGERPTARMMVGFAVIFFAVLLSQRSDTEKQPKGEV